MCGARRTKYISTAQGFGPSPSPRTGVLRGSLIRSPA